MIQIIPENRRPSTGQRLSEGIGKGLETATQMYSQYKKEQEEKGRREEDNEYYRELTGHNLPNDPKSRQKAMELALQGKTRGQVEARESKLNKEMMSFADKLEANNPKSPMHKTIAEIYRSEMPMEDKSQMVRALTGVDPFKVDQQQRLEKDMFRKLYSNKIKEIQDQLKTAKSYPRVQGEPSEREQLLQQLAEIQAQRDQVFFGEEAEAEEEMEEEVGVGAKEKNEGPKVAFDPSNKKHKAAAEKLYKKYKDKEKVRKILSKNFMGL